MVRPSARARDELRTISFTRKYTRYAEGSVLVEYGATKVLCNASVVQGVPRFLKNTGKGWLTSTYGMLPRATHDRIERETRSGPSGRTQEIQRLIGRALRAMVNLDQLGEYTINVDCDVIQADGGTRTASISGGCVAIVDALKYMMQSELIKRDPMKFLLASISVGVYQGVPILDLDYSEDSNAETDMNVVMTEKGEFIEIQGTAEHAPFKVADLQGMLELAKAGIAEIIKKQRMALEIN